MKEAKQMINLQFTFLYVDKGLLVSIKSIISYVMVVGATKQCC